MMYLECILIGVLIGIGIAYLMVKGELRRLRKKAEQRKRGYIYPNGSP